MSDNCVVCLRVPGGAAEWRVWYGGKLCSPSWNARGPALAYLNALVRGVRKPEYSDQRKEQAS